MPFVVGQVYDWDDWWTFTDDERKNLTNSIGHTWIYQTMAKSITGSWISTKFQIVVVVMPDVSETGVSSDWQEESGRRVVYQ